MTGTSSRCAQRPSKRDLLQRAAEDGDKFAALGLEIGPEALDRVLQVVGGREVYIPDATAYWRRILAQHVASSIDELRREMPPAEIARRYGLSERTIHRYSASLGEPIEPPAVTRPPSAVGGERAKLAR